MAAERKPEFFAGKDMQIGIIGCGYVGLPLALRFADVGQRVTGFDLDQTKVDKLNAGAVVHPAHSRGQRFASTCKRNGCARRAISRSCAGWTRC